MWIEDEFVVFVVCLPFGDRDHCRSVVPSHFLLQAMDLSSDQIRQRGGHWSYGVSEHHLFSAIFLKESAKIFCCQQCVQWHLWHSCNCGDFNFKGTTCKSVVPVYEMHVAYEDLLQEAEERLTNIYREVEQ